ncbi:MAG: ABC transporter permease [Lentisphaerae bacterium]|nr:ABC transporter permease [Lentisphaerota bacterium]
MARQLFVRISRSRLMERHGAWLALVLLLLVCAISSPAFRSPQNLLNISRQISYSGIIAIGMTFVIIGGGIDLSVGALLAFSGTLGIMAMNRISHPLVGVLICLAVSLLTGAVGGMLNGLLVTLGRIPPFIVTLGTMSIFRSLTLYLANAGLTSTSNELFGRIGAAEILHLPLTACLLLILTFAGSVLLNRTAFGRHLCATGANERVALYAAIRIDLLRLATYLLCGVLAGLSAFLLGGRLSSLSSTTAGNAYEMDGIAAAIIGGTAMSGGRGSIWGTLAGAFILGIVSNVLDMWGISANLQGTVKGAVIIIAVLLQRQDAKHS